MAVSLIYKHHYSSIKLYILYVVAAAILSLCYGDGGYTCSRATYYGSPQCLGNPKGACGFGEYGRTLNNGVVSGVSKLYANGSHCGACYQVRCTIQGLCKEEGTKVMVTDYGEGDHTDFVMSGTGYSSLATSESSAAKLLAYGVVDVEYRRVPCQQGGYNLMLKVHEGSSYPHYLALLVIYQGGLEDVTSVEILAEDHNEWVCMRRVFGSVFDLQNPPKGHGSTLNLRMQLTSTDGYNKWLDLPNVFPSYWKPGAAYETALNP